MEPDEMPPKERAWLVAGHRTAESRVAHPIVLAPDGMPPLIMLPPGMDAWAREEAHGWGFAELVEQRGGWLYLVRRLCSLGEAVGKLASAVVAVWLMTALM